MYISLILVGGYLVHSCMVYRLHAINTGLRLGGGTVAQSYFLVGISGGL